MNTSAELYAAIGDPEPVTGCRNWKMGVDSWGYGRLRWKGKPYQLAHRMAWMLAHGEIGSDVCVLHRCDNPLCCNVEHLFTGSLVDNVRDMDMKGRRRTAIAGALPQTKLVDSQVREIRERHAFAMKRRSKMRGVLQPLAAEFGVTAGNIGQIVRRESWKHLEAPQCA